MAKAARAKPARNRDPRARADVIECLRTVEILDGLTAAELERVASAVRPVTFDPGSVIMREGEPGHVMYLIADGEVEVSKNLTLRFAKGGYGQAEKSMIRLKAGAESFFGDMAIIEDDSRSATVTACAPCLLYELTREDFEQLCDKEPIVAKKILLRVAKVLCKRIRDGNQDVMKLTTALSIAISQ